MKKYMTLVLCMTLLFIFGHHTLAHGASSVRVDGKDRFAVAVNVSKMGWPDGAETVVIANYTKFADALAASPLAYQDNGPILLTQPNQLTQSTSDEMTRLHPKHIIVVGGAASVSDAVLAELKRKAPDVIRIGGQDRFEVALNISKALKPTDNAVITNGLKFPDALSIAPYASRHGYPILLTSQTALPKITQTALAGKQKTLVIGGTGSVSDTILHQLPNATRIGGKDRFEVATNIIHDLNMNTSQLFIATGLKFADALTGSVLAAKRNVPLALTLPTKVPTTTRKMVLNESIHDFMILGGTGSVGGSTVSQLTPIQNQHSIEGYTNQVSYYPGDPVDVMVHAPRRQFSIDIIRFGKIQQSVYSDKTIASEPQNYYSDASQEGALWKPSYQFHIPVQWSSGMYAAKLYDGDHVFYIPFIIKEKSPSSNSIGVIASTNTWEAYNNWAGKSLYSYDTVNGTRHYNPIVSYLRPNPGNDPSQAIGHLASGEKYILSWLETNNYHYSMLTDKDLDANPALLRQFKTIIISTHSEYWTSKMYDGLENYLNHGGNLLYLSGNGIYWKAVIKDHQIEVKKDGSRHTFDSEMGGNFYKIGRPETSVLGVGYRLTGFSVPAPYKVVTSTHWIFAHTGLRIGDLIGTTGLNKVKNSSGAASGWETDQIDRYTPRNAVILARGMNIVGKGADMIYYDHPGGGGVFSAGSITFGGSLVVDRNLSQMVKNVLNHFGNE